MHTHNYKLKNIENLSNIIESSKYKDSEPERGKPNKAHKDVKEWHYFVNEIETEDGVFEVTVNIRDKGYNQYIYEVTFKKKKT